MGRKWILPTLAAAALAFAVRHVVEAQQSPPKLPPPVDPAKNPYRGSIAASGVVEPASENIALGAHVSGVVAEVLVAVGRQVEAGELLFRLDDRQTRAELAVRKATLERSGRNSASCATSRAARRCRPTRRVWPRPRPTSPTPSGC